MVKKMDIEKVLEEDITVVEEPAPPPAPLFLLVGETPPSPPQPPPAPEPVAEIPVPPQFVAPVLVVSPTPTITDAEDPLTDLPEKMPWGTVAVLAVLIAVSLGSGIYYWYTAYFRDDYVVQTHLQAADPQGEQREQNGQNGRPSDDYPPADADTPPPLPRPELDPMPEIVALWEEHGDETIVAVLILAGQEILTVQGDGLAPAFDAVFLDGEVDLLFGTDLNMVIHVSEDSAVREILREYMQHEFFLTHPTIEFFTVYGAFDWEIFAFYIAPSDFPSRDFPYVTVNHPDDYVWGEMLEQFTIASLYNTRLDVTLYDQILTITAPTDISGLYYVLQARMYRHITS